MMSVERPDLDDLAKLPKVSVCLEQVLVAQLQGKSHHIDQISLDHPHILQHSMLSVLQDQACIDKAWHVFVTAK